jgi:hypothetical protein
MNQSNSERIATFFESMGIAAAKPEGTDIYAQRVKCL